MAAALADRIALERGLDAEIRSAGTLGLVDRPADPKTVAVCRELGLDLTGHRSAPLTTELCAWADRIFVMELRHAEVVAMLHEKSAEKVVQLGPLVGAPEIADPIGSWFKGAHRQARDQLLAALQRALP